jgi:hypothetical protein
MKMPMVILYVIVIFCAQAMAQEAPTSPLKVEDITTGLANRDFIEVPVLKEVVQSRGISFDLNKQRLAEILEAAKKGDRDPGEMAELIFTCIQVCESCRSQSLDPISFEDLKRLSKWGFGPPEIDKEARVRGVKDLQVSKEAADELRAAGLKEEVIAFLVPDDRIPTSPMEGYKTFSLKRADEYDLAAPEGFLKVTASLRPNSQSEFFFKHNSLFVKALKGMEPEDLGAFFNKPTPRNTDIELVDFTSGVGDYEEKGGLLGIGKKKESPIVVTKVKADNDGRTAFRIVMTNKETNRPQRYSFYIRWHLLTEPKPASPASKR